MMMVAQNERTIYIIINLYYVTYTNIFLISNPTLYHNNLYFLKFIYIKKYCNSYNKLIILI